MLWPTSCGWFVLITFQSAVVPQQEAVGGCRKKEALAVVLLCTVASRQWVLVVARSSHQWRRMYSYYEDGTVVGAPAAQQ